ncbi:MAG: pathogenicity locus [Bacteroidetes bacterium]|nr:pathogenicity locus [Bacteroidota bacterium]
MKKDIDAKSKAIKALTVMPGIGKSLATDLWNIGISSVADLKDNDPEMLYNLSNKYTGCVQNRCVLYAFRCAVYYANTPLEMHDPEKLKWWKWKDAME